MRPVDALDRAEAAINRRLPGPLTVGALTLYLHSTRTSERVDRLGAHPWWRRWSDAGVATLALVQVLGVAVLGPAL